MVGICEDSQTIPAIDWDPSWSPDGKRIAFMSDRRENFDIYVMDADGGNLRRLTDNLHDDTVCPPGLLTVQALSSRPTRDGNYEIYVMDANGRKSAKSYKQSLELTTCPPGPPTANALLSRPTGITEWAEIYVMDADGDNLAKTHRQSP